MKRSVLLYGFLFLSVAKANSVTVPGDEIKQEAQKIDYRIVKELPHDTTAFTEGFVFYNKQLFESTGSPDDLPDARSYFGPINMKTGKIDKKVELDRDTYFGEGIAFLRGKIFQLTYTSQICFVYDDITYKKLGEFKFSNAEGWGLTTDGKNLIMSDGTSHLSYRDPDNFKLLRQIQVTENNKPVTDLNELEFIKGFVYANVWFTNNIVKIDPASGKVVAKLDLTRIQEKEKLKNPHLDMMNGIAFDPSSDKIYITGKLWSTIYQIDFIH